jgi:pimeloyl-ACP methyl ester carboxylesterase
MTKPTAHQIDLFGSNAHYWIYHADQPKTIVMVHGFRGTHHGLENIIHRLPEYNIIIPDLPGFGDSTPMTKRSHDIDGYRDFIMAFIKKVAPKQPELLGHSFGSIVAASVAASAPELTNKLVLVNPIANSPLAGPRTIFTRFALFYYWLGRRLPASMGRALLGSPPVVVAISSLMAKTKDKSLRRAIHQSHLRHFSRFHNRDILAEAFKASVEHTATEYAPHIHKLTLLIAGDIDDIAPLSGQYTLEKTLPNARLIIIPGVGHLIHHEAPQQAATEIQKFLNNSD